MRGLSAEKPNQQAVEEPHELVFQPTASCNSSPVFTFAALLLSWAIDENLLHFKTWVRQMVFTQACLILRECGSESPRLCPTFCTGTAGKIPPKFIAPCCPKWLRLWLRAAFSGRLETVSQTTDTNQESVVSHSLCIQVKHRLTNTNIREHGNHLALTHFSFKPHLNNKNGEEKKTYHLPSQNPVSKPFPTCPNWNWTQICLFVLLHHGWLVIIHQQ